MDYVTCRDEGKGTFELLYDYYCQNRMTDTVIVGLDSCVFHVHKIVLVSRSNFFENIFKEYNPKVIFLMLSKACISLLVELIYRFSVEISQDISEKIKEVANIFQIKYFNTTELQESDSEGEEGFREIDDLLIRKKRLHPIESDEETCLLDSTSPSNSENTETPEVSLTEAINQVSSACKSSQQQSTSNSVINQSALSDVSTTDNLATEASVIEIQQDHPLIVINDEDKMNISSSDQNKSPLTANLDKTIDKLGKNGILGTSYTNCNNKNLNEFMKQSLRKKRIIYSVGEKDVIYETTTNPKKQLPEIPNKFPDDPDTTNMELDSSCTSDGLNKNQANRSLSDSPVSMVTNRQHSINDEIICGSTTTSNKKQICEISEKIQMNVDLHNTDIDSDPNHTLDTLNANQEFKKLNNPRGLRLRNVICSIDDEATCESTTSPKTKQADDAVDSDNTDIGLDENPNLDNLNTNSEDRNLNDSAEQVRKRRTICSADNEQVLSESDSLSMKLKSRNKRQKMVENVNNYSEVGNRFGDTVTIPIINCRYQDLDCAICLKTFTEIKFHIRAEHNKRENQVKCGSCHKRFYRDIFLQLHKCSAPQN